MALFGMELKQRRKRVAGLLSTHDVGLSGKDLKRHRGQSGKGLLRFAGSWAALSLGLFTCYTAVHYAPAVVSFDKVLGVGGPASQSAAMEDRSRNPLAPYLELLELDRTYLRAGQGIRAEYRVPTGGTVDLSVVRCESAVVVEVFRCVPVATSEFTVTEGAGSRVFQFADSGFYHFHDHARGSTDYRVVWSRS